MKWLDNLRQKSDKQKNIIALSTAFSITVLIFTVWLSTLSPRFNTTEEDVVVKRSSPLRDINENLAAAFETVGNLWEEMALSVQQLMAGNK